MSKIFDALKKAKDDKAESLFRPSASKESVARAPKYFENLPPAAERAAEPLKDQPTADEQIKAETGAPIIEPPRAVTPSTAPTQAIEPPPTAVVPIIPPPSRPRIVREQQIEHQKIKLEQTNADLVVIAERSPASEQFAGLRAKLMVLRREQNLGTFCVTSSVMNEGKTFVSTNLALTLASESERGGIIIDCDLRNPSVHKMFGIRDAIGLSEYLQSDEIDIDSIIIDTDRRLSIIPAGRIPKNPLPLLDSDKLKELLKELRARYDFIIIDSPPTAPLVDADILASLSEGVLFVVRAGETPLTMIERSLKMLSKRRILGTVLNATDEMPNYGYYYTYGVNKARSS